jgi:hypothetical protein
MSIFAQVLSRTNTKEIAKTVTIIESRKLDFQNVATVLDFNFNVSGLQEAQELVLASTKNKMTLLKDGFKNISGNSYKGIVTANRINKPFRETSAMTKLSSAKFIDTASNVWNVIGEGNDRRIVIEQNEDMEAILSTLTARKAGSKFLQSTVKTGDFASLVKDGQIRSGFVYIDGNTATLIQPQFGSRETVSVDKSAIYEVCNPSKVFDNFPTDYASKQDLMDYLSKVYSYNPKFLDKLRTTLGV